MAGRVVRQGPRIGPAQMFGGGGKVAPPVRNLGQAEMHTRAEGIRESGYEFVSLEAFIRDKK